MVDYRDFMARYRYWLSEPKHARTVKAFNHALAVFLGDFDDVEIDESPLRLSVRKSGYRLGLDQLSDGERSFLAIVSDLVRRLALANPELKNPLLGAGVVLIDELELHLHPTWQRSVADKLRATFPNIQFIATTHSPFVLQSLKAGELINLDPDEFGAEYAGKSVEDIAEQVMGVRVPQKSERFLAMVKTAEEYLRRARSAAPTSNAAADALRTDLDKLIEPYSDDPAYVALLRLEREKALGGGQHAAN
jgi:predicted ATP-binding protein involved in virulence